jgi:hypothetical protein
MFSHWKNERVLIVVRTYPTPANRGIEVSCTAGISQDGRWVRLFPLPYRLLKAQQKFAKYQWIEANLKKANDSRPESFNIDPDSIAIVSDPLPANTYWRARKQFIQPLEAHCMCCIQQKQRRDGFPTLGFFKPHVIRRLIIQPESNPTWTEQELAKLSQTHMFDEAPKSRVRKDSLHLQIRVYL